MSFSLLPQQYPACLVRLTMMVFQIKPNAIKRQNIFIKKKYLKIILFIKDYY